MTHAVSFMLFAAFLYYFQLWHKAQFKIQYKTIFCLAVISALLFVVRPINIVFVVFVLGFFQVFGLQALFERAKLMLRPRVFLPFLGLGIVFLIPQLVYYKYAHGSFFLYSYGEEGFNWLAPEVFNHFFSWNNGQLIYVPFFAFVLWGLVLILLKKYKPFYTLVPFYILIMYLFASWHSWHFGCGFGMRPYVEFYALFSIPLLVLFEKVKPVVLYVLMLPFLVYNLALTEVWTNCIFFENGDYSAILKMLLVALHLD